MRLVLGATYTLLSADGKSLLQPAVYDLDMNALSLIESGCRGERLPPEAPGTGACRPGATERDCALCGSTGPTVPVCPKVDCSVYPFAPECAAVCTGANERSAGCGRCQPRGKAGEWVGSQTVACGTGCSALRMRWSDELAATPALRSCTTDDDCGIVAYPNGSRCEASVTGLCGAAVNGKSYPGSKAAELQGQYGTTCAAEKICDCAPPIPRCVQGRCEAMPGPNPVRDGGP